MNWPMLGIAHVLVGAATTGFFYTRWYDPADFTTETHSVMMGIFWPVLVPVWLAVQAGRKLAQWR